MEMELTKLLIVEDKERNIDVAKRFFNSIKTVECFYVKSLRTSKYIIEEKSPEFAIINSEIPEAEGWPASKIYRKILEEELKRRKIPYVIINGDQKCLIKFGKKEIRYHLAKTNLRLWKNAYEILKRKRKKKTELPKLLKILKDYFKTIAR